MASPEYMGVARVIKVEGGHWIILATPSTSLKIFYYPPPQVFSHQFLEGSVHQLGEKWGHLPPRGHATAWVQIYDQY